MKREDFKEIKEEHFSICEKLIKQKGRCENIACIKDHCPFSQKNSMNDRQCADNKYSDGDTYSHLCDDVLLESAKEFLKFRDENRMGKEKVLEVEFQDVFEKVAVRIKYQNEEVLKRAEFKDDQINVASVTAPTFGWDRLYLRGSNLDHDNNVEIVTKEKAEDIKKKVDAINEKYGVPKKWRAEKGERYWLIDSVFRVRSVVDHRYVVDDKRYESGNYFRTEKEAQIKLDKIKQIFKED